MQTPMDEQAAGRLNHLFMGIGIGLALVLFFSVIGRMGLLRWPGGGAETAAAGAVVLTSQDMRFTQDAIPVRVGQPVVLKLNNADLYAHSFDVDALDLHVAMPAKGHTSVTFTPAAPGSYPFYCGVPGHAQAGMVGTLQVEP